MADTSGTIGSGGDYTDVADWESSIDVSTDPCVGSFLDGFEQTSTFTIDGYSPTSTNYVLLTSEDGAEHNGTAHEVSSKGNARIVTTIGNCITILDPYTRVSWLEVYNTAGDSFVVSVGGFTIGQIHHNIVHQTGSGNAGFYTPTSIGHKIYRNIIYGCGYAGVYMRNGTTDAECMYNSIIYNNRRNNAIYSGYRTINADCSCLYNALYENLQKDIYNATGTLDYNWTSDTYDEDKNGANGLGDRVVADDFEAASTTWATFNGLIKAGSSLIGNGISVSTTDRPEIDESIDNRGVSITGSWDIGASEYVASGGVSITPLTIASGESVGTPSISLGGVEIVPLTTASGESVGTPTITQGTEITPLTIASGESVGTPSISVGGVEIVPLSIASSESVGTPSISVGGIEVVPLSIASSEVVGNPTITVGGTSILPLSIASSESVGNPTVSVGGIEIIPLSISSSESVGNPTITQGETITPITIVSGEVVNNPSISVGGVEIVPTSISSSEFVGLPSISVEGIEIVPVTIPTSETVNNPTISVGSVYIVPITIASSEALGTPTITGGTPSEDFVNIITGSARIHQIITGSARIHQVITGKARISV